MSTIKYTVKARDNAGHEYIQTFRHHADARMKSSNPREGLAFCQEIVEEYKGCILNGGVLFASSQPRRLFMYPQHTYKELTQHYLMSLCPTVDRLVVKTSAW